MPAFGTLRPARDYPSAPSVDLKHDRGNCAVGDLRDRWKESCREDIIKQEEGDIHHSVRLNLETGQNERTKVFPPFHRELHLLFTVDSNEEILVI